MPLEPYLRNGRYWVRGRLADGDRYVRQSLGTADREIAEAEVRAIEAQARKRRILGPDAPKPQDELTFASAVLLYEAQPKEAAFLIPIVKQIGALRVREITPRFVRRLAAELYPDAATDTWQRQVVTPVRSVINNAHELGKCAPIRIRAFSREERIRQDRLRGKESRRPKTPGSWQWLKAFMAAAEPRDAALAYFMFRHGARISQSLAMTRSRDLDLSAARVRLPAAKGHPAQWIDLDPEEVAMIANLPVPYRGQARDRVFTIAGGRSGALYKRWRETCARAEIDYLPPHSAGRHGFGTEMFVRQAARVDPVSAAREGRWSSPIVPLRTYAHAEDSAAKVAAAFAAGKRASRTKPVQRGRKKSANHVA